jgi:hypothetical protein
MFIVNFYNSLEPIHQSVVVMLFTASVTILAGLIGGKFATDDPKERSSSKPTLL